MRNMQEKMAETISAFLNAPLVALYVFLFLFFSLRPPPSPAFLVISSFFGSILPIAVILYLTRKGVIPDVYASNRETRTKPFVGALGSCLCGVIVLVFFQAPQIMVSLMACYFVNSFVMMIITQTWKISVHASGITGPATFLVHQLGIGMLPFFALILPVGWARIKLEAHNLSQVVAGALLTVGLTLIQLELYL
jgi:membrane-associated phospholipid phosphatase